MADPVSPFSFGYGRRAAATKAESAWKAKQPTFAPEPPTPAKKRNTTTQSGRKVSSSYAEVDSDADWEDEEGEWAERTAPRRQTNAKRKSYKELDSNEDESEEDREVDIERQKRRAAAVDQVNVIEKILDVRETEGIGEEYLVHWHGEAHLWDSWHTEEELSDIVTGGNLKRLTNYQRAVREFQAWKLTASPEEIEQALVNIEMGRNDFRQWIIVERIVDSRSVPTAQVRELQKLRKFRNKRNKSILSPTPPAPSAPATARPTTITPKIESSPSPPLTSPNGSPVPETPDAAVSGSSVWAMAAQQFDGIKSEESKSAVTAPVTSSPPAAGQDVTVKMELESHSIEVKLESKEQGDVAMKTEDDDLPLVPLKAEYADEDADDDDDDNDDDDSDDDYDDTEIETLQYFVKWSGLPYEENTWETFDDIIQYQAKIDDFMNGGSASAIAEIHNNIPGLLKRATEKTRKNFVALKEQPPYLTGGELRDYQIAGLNYLAYSWSNNINGILADEMGLGKTIQCISFLSWLAIQRGIVGPFLVVAPLSTIASWQRECEKWAGFLNTVIYTGSKKSREIIREYEWYATERTKGSGRHAKTSSKSTIKFSILITTYEFVISDRNFLNKIHWSYLMVDEAHRLKDSNSLLYQVLAEFKTDSRLLITGTPLQNTLRELWCLLHFLDPLKFGSLEEFEERYSGVTEGEGVADLHALLLPHLFRRTKKDVLKSLPPKHERILAVDMAPMQRKYYRWIIRGNFRELNRGVKGKKSQLTNICMELRKVTNSPLLFPRAQIEEAMASEATVAAIMQCNSAAQAAPATDAAPTDVDATAVAPVDGAVGGGSSGVASSIVFSGVEPGSQLDGLIRSSGKMILLDKLLLKLKATGHRCLIFSQMVKMIDILSNYCQLRGFIHQRLDGSMSSTNRQRSMDHFNAPGSSDFLFLLSTRAGGLGINLTSADTVIIFDSDWNPSADLQAMARAHRMGQTKSVMIYRLVTRGSIEEKILERAKKKLILDHLVIQRMDTSRNADSNGAGASKQGAAMFSRAELAKIVQFGAEDLFSQVDDEANTKSLADLDIDEILSRADAEAPAQEDAAEEARKNDATEAFLGAFKVANFSSSAGDVPSDDDDDGAAANSDDEEVDWSKIVPAALIPADQLSADGTAVPLYLPPRARNQVKSYAENQLARNEAQSKEEGDDADHDAGGDDEEEDAGVSGRRVRKSPTELDTRDAKHCIRALMMTGEVIGAVDEMTRQVWSRRGVDRADGVAFIEGLVSAVKNAVEAAKMKPDQEATEEEKTNEEETHEAEDAETKKKKRIDSSVTGEYMGATFNATDILSRMEEFAILRRLIPAKNPTAYRILTRKPIPPIRWAALPPGMRWKNQHDAMLLVGIHWYGLNQMDRLIDDDRLGLKPLVAVKENTNTNTQEQPMQTDETTTNNNDNQTSQPKADEETHASPQESPAPAAVTSTSAPVDQPPPPSADVPMEDVAPAVSSPAVDATAPPAAAAGVAMDTATDAAQPTTTSEESTPMAVDAAPETIPAPITADETAAPPAIPSSTEDDSVVWTRIVKNPSLMARAVALLRALSADAKQQQEDKDDEAARAELKKAKLTKAKKEKQKNNTDASGDGDGDKKPKEPKEKKSSSAKDNKRIDAMFKKADGAADPTAATEQPNASTAPSSPQPANDANTDEPPKSNKKKSKDKEKEKDKEKKKRSRSPGDSSDDDGGDRKKHKKDSKDKDSKKKDKDKGDKKEKSAKKEKEKSAKKSDSSKKDNKPLSSADADDIEIDAEVLAQCKPLLKHLAPKLRELHHLANVAEGGFAGHKAETQELITYIGEDLLKVVRSEVKEAGLQRQYLLIHLWEYVGKFTQPKHSAKKLRNFFKLFTSKTNTKQTTTTTPTTSTTQP